MAESSDFPGEAGYKILSVHLDNFKNPPQAKPNMSKGYTWPMSQTLQALTHRFSTEGGDVYFCLPGGHLTMSADTSDCHNSRVLLPSGG